MGNMIDYLRWRGDITFEKSPFCEVDALIVTYLAYVNLDGIAPEVGGGFITVEDAAKIFAEKYSPEQLKEDRSFVYESALDKKMQVFNDILGEWLNGLDKDRRNGIINDLFDVLEATGAHTLTQVQEGGIKNAAVMLKQIEELNPQTRESIEKLMKSLVAHWDKLLK